MITNNLVMEPPEKVLVITRIFDAPPKLVFKAWKDCANLKKWWGPKDYTTASCEVDFRIGGNWRINILSDKGIGHWHKGVYKDITESQKIVFTHEWEYTDKVGPETTVTVLFEDEQGKTKLTFHQALMIDAADRDNHIEGWSGCLDHLEEYLAVKN
ncbi:MAG: SRPBCC domain-containing protein [bacterium]